MDPDVVAFTDRLNAAFARLPESGIQHAEDFPRGQCGRGAPVAANLLREAGFGVWEIVTGYDAKTSDWRTHHTWLERGGVYYDPTAHQFPEHKMPLLGTGTTPLKTRFALEVSRRPKSRQVDLINDAVESFVRDCLN